MLKQSLPTTWENLINSESSLPIVIQSITRVMDEDWQADEPSVHEHFEFLFVKKAGSAFFEIGEERVAVNNNDMLLIKPNQPHKLQIPSGDDTRFLVLKFIFNKKTNTEISTASLEDFLDFITNYESGGYIRLQSKYQNEIVSTLQKIMAEHNHDDDNSEFLCSILMMEVFVYLSRTLKDDWENSIRNKGDKLKELMDIAKKHIDDNYFKDIELKDIASFIYLSTSHFAREFKKTYKISPIQYLLTKRIQKSTELLQETEMRIGEIALSVGFSAQQRFNDIFKKQIKISPTEYREQYRKSILNK